LYDVCRSFWYGLFERCCQRPNAHTRLFPTNKPMQMIWEEYFLPWHVKTQGEGTHIPGYTTFLKARGDNSFKDVKRRPKHFHAQCGVCYRLKLRMLKGFKTNMHEARWSKRLKNHDKRVVEWRSLVECVINASRHDPGEVNAIFFDDTESTGFPNVTNRGLKDMPTAQLHFVPWCVQDFASGKDSYFYMIKKAYKKGGNRICTQLYHQIRKIKTGGGRASKARKLYLIADNYSENKNNTLFAFLSDLVRHGWYDKIYLLFGEVGHTHNGDDAQHAIHNNGLGQYFCPTLVHWIEKYPHAWRSEKTRPEPHLLHVQYDFDKYYRGCLDELAGFTKTQEDPVLVRGFLFQLEENNMPTVKISVDPAKENGWLGRDNQASSRGYCVLKRPPLPTQQLTTVPHNEDVMDPKYRKMLLGTKMRDTMEAGGELESLDWLQAAAQSGLTPIERVIEDETPPGHMGRLVELKCGDAVAQCREIISPFIDGEFDHDAFWVQPLEHVPADVVPEQEHDNGDPEDLPCVGYKRIRPDQRPAYVGSKRQKNKDRAARVAAQEEVEEEFDPSDEHTDFEGDNEEEGGRRGAKRSKKQSQRKPKAGPKITYEHRDVRCIVGNYMAGSKLPELWFYTPQKTTDAKDAIRSGWWLQRDDDDGAEDADRLYIAGRLSKIQRTKKVVFTDVGNFPQVRFRRTAVLNAKGKETKGKTRVQFVEALTAEQLAPANAALAEQLRIAGEDAAGGDGSPSAPSSSSDDGNES
jgi:hypothetical protein